MRFSNPNSLGLALGAGILASVAMLPQARGDLVYETEAQPQAAAPVQVVPPVQAIPPVQMQRVVTQAPVQQFQPIQQQVPQQVLVPATSAVVPQQVVMQQPIAQQPVMQPVSAFAPAPVPASAPVPVPVVSSVAAASASPASDDDVTNMTKSELVRRERLRAELHNEDVLQERLEELRLRDERRRTDQLVAGQPITETAPTFGVQAQPAAPTTVPIGQMALTQQAQPLLAAPVQSAPVAPMGTQVAQAPIAQDQLMTSQGMAVSTTRSGDIFDKERETTTVYVQPRAGLTSFNNVTFYDIRSKYAAGLGLGLGVSDNLSFELGYTYSEFGVAMNASNPWAIQAQVEANARGYTGSFETVAMKQNVIDAGLKVHFLGPNAKLRPFIGGGAAYSKTFINFNQDVIARMQQSGQLSPDYDLNQFLGFLSTGLDVRVNRSISIGAVFKYYSVLSYRQNQDLNGQAFSGNYPYTGYYPYATTTAVSETDKQKVGGDLAQNAFYSINGGVSFSF